MAMLNYQMVYVLHTEFFEGSFLKIWCWSWLLRGVETRLHPGNENLVGGFNPSEKYEFVSWDYYSQYMESHKIHVPNHQPETYITVMLKVKSWISNRNEKVVTSSLYTGCLIVVHPRMIVIFHIFS